MTNVNLDRVVETERAFSTPVVYAKPLDIRLEGKRGRKKIVWRYYLRNNGLTKHKVELNTKVTPDPVMLNQFIKLAGATNEEILEYARRWGVLNLCERDKLPASHNPSCDVPSEEPVAKWRSFALMMQAVLNISSKLVIDELGEMSDWNILIEANLVNATRFGSVLSKAGITHQETLKFQRRQIASVIDQWIMWSALRPVITWHENNVSVTLTGSPKAKLFGALVSNLLLMAGRSGVACCSECREWYVREERQAKRGQLNYCSSCGRKAAQRNATRAYRARKNHLK